MSVRMSVCLFAYNLGSGESFASESSWYFQGTSWMVLGAKISRVLASGPENLHFSYPVGLAGDVALQARLGTVGGPAAGTGE